MKMKGDKVYNIVVGVIAIAMEVGNNHHNAMVLNSSNPDNRDQSCTVHTTRRTGRSKWQRIKRE